MADGVVKERTRPHRRTKEQLERQVHIARAGQLLADFHSDDGHALHVNPLLDRCPSSEEPEKSLMASASYKSSTFSRPQTD